MGKGGPRYTPEQARARIPILLRRIALTTVDIAAQLDVEDINSQAIETRVLALSGMVGLLNRLCHVVWKYESLTQTAEAKITEGAA